MWSNDEPHISIGNVVTTCAVLFVIVFVILAVVNSDLGSNLETYQTTQTTGTVTNMRTWQGSVFLGLGAQTKTDITILVSGGGQFATTVTCNYFSQGMNVNVTKYTDQDQNGSVNTWYSLNKPWGC